MTTRRFRVITTDGGRPNANFVQGLCGRHLANRQRCQRAEIAATHRLSAFIDVQTRYWTQPGGDQSAFYYSRGGDHYAMTTLAQSLALAGRCRGARRWRRCSAASKPARVELCCCVSLFLLLSRYAGDLQHAGIGVYSRVPYRGSLVILFIITDTGAVGAVDFHHHSQPV